MEYFSVVHDGLLGGLPLSPLVPSMDGALQEIILLEDTLQEGALLEGTRQEGTLQEGKEGTLLK